MKARPFILRLAAFFLIIVFSQKAGTGLFLHNWLHTSNSRTASSPDENKQGNEINYSCSCIDDFLLPFDEAVEPVYTPFVSVPETPVSFYYNETPFHSPELSFLRGPPACNL